VIPADQTKKPSNGNPQDGKSMGNETRRKRPGIGV
jgi:hypothetical protein